MSRQAKPSKTARSASPTEGDLPQGSWVIEYGQRRSERWTRVGYSTMQRVLEEDFGLSPVGMVLKGMVLKGMPFGQPAVIGTDVVTALRLLLALNHFHVDRDGRSVPEIEFQARDLTSGDIIPDWFITRECMCDRHPCKEARRDEWARRTGLDPNTAQDAADLRIHADSTILRI